MTAIDEARAKIEKLTREGFEEQLLTADQAAKILGTSRRAVYEWGRTGKMPRVVHNSRNIKYRLSDVRRMIRDSLEERK